nr:PspC domain-containing protein [uncultured Sphingosinicella sp.]
MDRDDEAEQHEAMLMGVCVQLASWMDVHPSLVRVNVVLAGILFFPLVIAAYVLSGLLMGRRSIAY